TAYADVPQILGTVPWVALTGTGAVALTAFAIIHGNDAPAKIAEILDLTEQLFPAQLQIAQWLVHSASYLNVCTHSDYRAKKEKTQLPPTKLAHTRLQPATPESERASAILPIGFALFDQRSQTFLRIFEAVEFVEEDIHGVLEAVAQRHSHAAEDGLFRHGEHRPGVAVDAIHEIGNSFFKLCFGDEAIEIEEHTSE